MLTAISFWGICTIEFNKTSHFQFSTSFNLSLGCNFSNLSSELIKIRGIWALSLLFCKRISFEIKKDWRFDSAFHWIKKFDCFVISSQNISINKSIFPLLDDSECLFSNPPFMMLIFDFNIRENTWVAFTKSPASKWTKMEAKQSTGFFNKYVEISLIAFGSAFFSKRINLAQHTSSDRSSTTMHLRYCSFKIMLMQKNCQTCLF